MMIDSSRNHLSLTWGKPHATDAAPVIAYRVDAWMLGADGGARWLELGVTPINSFDAFNLKPGSQYHFRVTPRNRYGWGHSVQTSNSILVGGVESLPEFTKILPGQLKVLLAKEFKLDCIVKGNPKPNIIWYKDEVPIKSTERVVIKNIGWNCRLEFKAIDSSDSGRYTCEATNSQGRVSTFARLQVVSDPKIYEADHNLKQKIDSEMVSFLINI